MTKADLVKALQRFPEDAAIQLTVAGYTVALDHVEMVVDTGAVNVTEVPNDLTWQQILATKIRLLLVGTED